jgi:hypothetical protein
MTQTQDNILTESLNILKAIRKSATHYRCMNHPPIDRRCELCRRIDNLLAKEEAA